MNKHIVIVLLVCMLTSPLFALDRGHQNILKWGFQIQANVDVYTDPVERSGRWSHKNWLDSGFTGINYGGIFNNGFSPDGLYLWGAMASLEVSHQTLDSVALPSLPAMVSWKFSDEQDLRNSDEMTRILTWMDAVHDNPDYNDVILYTSQNSVNAGNQSLILSYMSQANPDMLFFNNYPFRNYTSNDSTIKKWYGYLANYRYCSKQGNDGTGATPIPFGTYFQTYVPTISVGGMPNANYRPSESEIRLNQFAAWAFGAKFATSFVYDFTAPAYWVPLMIDIVSDQQVRTTEYDYVANTNKQSLNLGPALIRLLSDDIRIIYGIGTAYTSAVTEGLSGADTYFTSIDNIAKVGGGNAGDVLVGFFKPLDESFDGSWTNQKYFMVVNALSAPSTTAANCSQSMTLHFNFGSSGITSLQRLRRDNGQVETVNLVSDGGSSYHYDLTLEGGTGDLFKFNTGAPFIGDGQAVNRPATMYSAPPLK